MIDLDALEALEKKATQGPWQRYRNADKEHDGKYVVSGADAYEPQLVLSTSDCEDNDIALFVAARNALPELLRLARIGQKVEEGK